MVGFLSNNSQASMVDVSLVRRLRMPGHQIRAVISTMYEKKYKKILSTEQSICSAGLYVGLSLLRIFFTARFISLILQQYTRGFIKELMKTAVAA